MSKSLLTIDCIPNTQRISKESLLTLQRSPTSMNNLQSSRAKSTFSNNSSTLKTGLSGSGNYKDSGFRSTLRSNISNLLRTSTSTGRRIITTPTDFDEFPTPKTQNLRDSTRLSMDKGFSSVKSSASWPKGRENDTFSNTIKNLTRAKDTKEKIDRAYYKGNVLKDSNRESRFSNKGKDLITKQKSVGQSKFLLTESDPFTNGMSKLNVDINSYLRNIFSFGKDLSKPLEESIDNISNMSNLSIPEEKTVSDNRLNMIFESTQKEVVPGNLKMKYRNI